MAENHVLIVVDMQEDFVTGALGSAAAEAIVPYVNEKIAWHVNGGRGPLIFTKDTHGADYLETQEGRNLPVPHCVKGTAGWEVVEPLRGWEASQCRVFEKPAFGSAVLAETLAEENKKEAITSITLTGLCTDICVISNAMVLKAFLPEVPVAVDLLCCAGVSRESAATALAAMRACQIETHMETPRLLLRPWRAADAEACFKYAGNPVIGSSCGWPVHKDVADSQEVIRTALSAPETYAVVLKETGEPVGSIGLLTGEAVHTAARVDGEGEIGFWVGEPYWGQGLIPEAVQYAFLRHCFENVGLDALWCGYFEGNAKSQRVQEKCGFRYHHTEEDKLCVPIGELRTTHFTYLSREDWDK
ncbi:MAG: isochorismatase family protein [Clostridiales Family XIII bacterium]|jgi:RimJ/RimL family protein N-acetyltransferase|nr:isochorismatase family protein [Clostridiales Family XIII bacterium]